MSQSELYDFVYYGGRARISVAINPDKHAADLAVAEWLEKGEIKREEDRDDDSKGSFDPLNKDQLNRQKYRFKGDDSIKQYFKQEAKWIAWSMYYNLCPSRVHEGLQFILKHANYADVTRLADIGGIYKKMQHLLTPDWLYFVDLQTLGDFALPISSEEVLEKTKFWLEKERSHALPDFDFYALYKFGCDQFLYPFVKPFTKAPLTVSQFLSDPNFWATNGSSDGKRLYAKDGTKAQKSKWASATAMSLPELLSVFYDPKPQSLNASVKRELAKSRMIIAGDLGNYLRMTYISYWLENVVRDHPHTTLFYSKRQTLQMWSEMVTNTVPLDTPIHIERSPATHVNVTLDESKFDHEVDSAMIKIKFDVILSFIKDYAPYSMLDMLVDAMQLVTRSCWNKGVVRVYFPGVGGGDPRWVEVNIKNGVPSGWRWTALIDTMSNAAKVSAFRLVVILRNGTLNDNRLDPVLDYTSQGDDLRSRMRSFLHASLFTDLYAEAGFQVHPTKFFTSPFADEFLRKVALYGHTLLGYPARGISTMLFRNPGKNQPRKGEGRIREMTANWLLIVRRMRVPPKQILTHMYRDIARANDMKIVAVKNYVHASANLGGVGIEPINNLKVDYIAAKFSESIDIVDPPLLDSLNIPNHLKRLAVGQWSGGITWPIGKKLLSPFSLSFTEAPPYRTSYAPIQRVEHRLVMVDGPNSAEGLMPTFVQASRTHTLSTRRSELLESAQTWMDGESVSILVKYMRTCGMSTIREWIKSGLLGSVPDSYIQGPTFISYEYATIARSAVARIMSRASVTYDAIVQARLQAEGATALAARQSKYSIME